MQRVIMTEGTVCCAVLERYTEDMAVHSQKQIA